jgi:RHS repeat-associated protein
MLELRYDTHGRLDRLVLPSGREARFEHDERGRLTRVFAPTRDGSERAVAARYTLDASGQLREASDALNRTTTYRYQARLLTQRKLPSGLVQRFVYDGQGASARCVGERWGEDEKEREVFFNPEERVVGLGDANGGSFSAHVNGSYLVDRALDHFANELTRSYDETSGLLSSETTTDGETTWLYDAAWHLADVSAPDQGSIALEHDAAGRLEMLTDPDGHARRWAWDPTGLLTAVVDSAGASTVYGYDGDGPLASILTPGEVRVTLEREPETKAAIAIHGPTGPRRASHDSLTRVTEVADELGQKTSFRYDPSGHVAQMELPGLVRAFESDDEGRVTSVRDGANAIVIERDGLGRVAHIDEGGGAGPRLHRDAEGRVTMVESEGNDLWELRRDAAGRVNEESGYGGEEHSVLRDHNGLVKRAMCDRVRAQVKRDAAGRPTELEHADGSFQRLTWTKGGRLARAQQADRVTSLERDGRGLITNETADEHRVTSRYDTRGDRVAIDSSLGLAVRIERDVFGHAMSIVATRGEQRLELRFDRDAAGRETRRHLPGGLALRWTRDGLGRPTERAVMFGDRVLATVGFHWVGIDRLVRVEDSQRGAKDHRHDERGRLVRVGGLVRALDDVGNVYRTDAKDDHRYADGRLVESYGTEYGYDGAGRRIAKKTPIGEERRYRWDGLGRLVEIWLADADRITYDYDGLGRMVARRRETKVEIEGLDEPVWEPARETRFVWDGLTILHEIDDGRVSTWLWEAGRLVGKLDDTGGFAALTDALGTPTELADAQGNLAWRGSVDLFGLLELDNAQTACPWRFPGHWEDPDTGLQHAWQRVYDPETGAYLTESPLGVAGGPNLYAYVHDPLSHASPLGLGRGYAALLGELKSERLDAELVERIVRALDRGDGAAGPRERFDCAAAQLRLPDPEAIFFGPWEAYRPSRRLPPETSSFTSLPETTGLSGR